MCQYDEVLRYVFISVSTIVFNMNQSFLKICLIPSCRDCLEEKPPEPKPMKVVNRRKSSLLACIEQNQIVQNLIMSTSSVNGSSVYICSPFPWGIWMCRDSIGISKLCISPHPVILSSGWMILDGRQDGEFKNSLCWELFAVLGSITACSIEVCLQNLWFVSESKHLTS